MSADMDFLAGLDMADKLVRAGYSEGMKAAGLQLYCDAAQDDPKIPHDEGTLQGSASVFVNDKLVASAPAAGGNPTPATSHRSGAKTDEVIGTVGFNTPYAAYQHEGARQDGTHAVAQKPATEDDPRGYTRGDGRGPKFLERALFENAKTYVGIVAARVRKKLSGGRAHGSST